MPYPNRLLGWRDTTPPPQASRVFFSYKILAPASYGAGFDEKKQTQIGTFQTFNPSSTRQVVRVRGIANNGGYPLELVPGPADTQINVTYLSLYLLTLNQALGYPIGSIIDLNRQRVPFDIQEQCVFPLEAEIESVIGEAGIPQSTFTTEVNHYYECYLTNIGRTITQGTVTIAETATIFVTGITTSWPAKGRLSQVGHGELVQLGSPAMPT